MKEINLPFDENSPEWCREYGKSLLNSDDNNERSIGIQNIIKAYSDGDDEATFIVGKLMLQGLIKPNYGDPEEFALTTLSKLSARGNIQARSLLNSYCFKRYYNSIKPFKAVINRPLVDFDGKKIKIQRKGIMTPIDASLDFVDGINRLTLSANISFWCCDFIEEPERFMNAVIEGIMQWQGDYFVFGNQLLQVVVSLTYDDRLWDNVVIIPMTEDIQRTVLKVSDIISTKNGKKRVDSLIGTNRSFAIHGFKKWSVRSRKIIYITSDDYKFDNYYDIKHIAKHEFGHALGLGDLYKSPSDNLNGVNKGTYSELDGFYVSDDIYNLAMCDGYGPISNNDIEMVVLAFWKNRSQLYQKAKIKDIISEALGRGN